MFITNNKSSTIVQITTITLTSLILLTEFFTTIQTASTGTGYKLEKIMRDYKSEYLWLFRPCGELPTTITQTTTTITDNNDQDDDNKPRKITEDSLDILLRNARISLSLTQDVINHKIYEKSRRHIEESFLTRSTCTMAEVKDKKHLPKDNFFSKTNLKKLLQNMYRKLQTTTFKLHTLGNITVATLTEHKNFLHARNQLIDKTRETSKNLLCEVETLLRTSNIPIQQKPITAGELFAIEQTLVPKRIDLTQLDNEDFKMLYQVEGDLCKFVSMLEYHKQRKYHHHHHKRIHRKKHHRFNNKLKQKKLRHKHKT